MPVVTGVRRGEWRLLTLHRHPPPSRGEASRGSGLRWLPGAHNRAVQAVGHLMRERDSDIGEPGSVKARAVLAYREGAGDAAGVIPTLGAVGHAEPILGDDVGYADAAAGP